MNAKYAIFGLISIKPTSIPQLRSRLPYSAKTVYENVELLMNDGLLVKVVQKDTSVLTVAEGYKPQKLREIVIQCLSHGIDYGVVLRKSTQTVWKAIEDPKTVLEIKQENALSGKWVRKVLHFMEQNELVKFIQRKPLMAVRDMDHPVNRLLLSYYTRTESENIVYYPGDVPFEEYLKIPNQIEKLLYEQIDRNITVKDTGFIVTGAEGRIAILESVNQELTIEDIFLRKIMTTEGVEDQCIHMVSQDIMDYDRLFQLAIVDAMTSIVGCYLDILYNIDHDIISKDIIEKFGEHIPPMRKTFLRQEREHGKSGWESSYEEKWNIDLYLDIGAIRHGVRGR